MRQTTLPSPRTGFTLIELLVVVAILTLLAAITAAGVGRVRSAQQVRVTDDTLNKLQLALEDQWRDVVQDARKDTNPDLQTVLSYCDGDKDRAKALLAHAYLKREFPQTFAEATTAVTVGPLTLPARKTFASATGAVTDEAAVLLYLILAEKQRGGAFAADDATAGAQTKDGNFTVFKDAWGNRIRFVRFYQYKEPGVNTNALDPRGKLAGTWTNKATALGSLNLNAGESAIAFDGTNRAATVISAGPNGLLDGLLADDHYGIQLRRQGSTN